MAASALLFHQGQLKQSSYQSGIKNTYGLSTPGSPGKSLTKLIEYYQISQLHLETNMYWGRINRNNIEGLVREVENFELTGKKPVVLAVFLDIGSGHAVVPFKVERTSAGYTRLHVWDNNHPDDVKILSISPNMKDWNYNGSGGQWGSSSGWLSYMPYEVIDLHKKSTTQYTGNLLIAANTPSLITNTEGISWEDIPGAYKLLYVSGDCDDNGDVYSLPTDYDYIITPVSGNALDVDIAGDSFHIQTDSSNAEAIIVSPGNLDVIIQSNADENEVAITIGTDDIECSITAIVSGDIQIVDEGNESIALLGTVDIIEYTEDVMIIPDGIDAFEFDDFADDEPFMADITDEYSKCQALFSESRKAVFSEVRKGLFSEDR